MKSKAWLLVKLFAVAWSIYLCFALIKRFTKPKEHAYHTVYHMIDRRTGDQTIGNFLSFGKRYTLVDWGWVRTNLIAGDTNKSVVILNVIRLDD